MNFEIRTRHGPVGFTDVFLHEDKTDHTYTSVHQPNQQTRGGKHLIAGCEGGHISKDHLQKQPWRTETRFTSRFTTTFRFQQIFLQLVIKNTFNASCTFSKTPGHSPALTWQVDWPPADLVRERPKDDVPHQKPSKEEWTSQTHLVSLLLDEEPLRSRQTDLTN